MISVHQQAPHNERQQRIKVTNRIAITVNRFYCRPPKHKSGPAGNAKNAPKTEATTAKKSISLAVGWRAVALAALLIVTATLVGGSTKAHQPNRRQVAEEDAPAATFSPSLQAFDAFWSSVAGGQSSSSSGVKTGAQSTANHVQQTPLSKPKRARGARSSPSRRRSRQQQAQPDSLDILSNINRKQLELADDSQSLSSDLQGSNPALQARPVRQTDSGQKCALILQRTYVRKISNDIDGDTDVEPTGRAERVCITYENVNEAIEEAKRRRRFKLTDDLMDAVQSIEPPIPSIAQLGELNLETVKVLRERFDLSPDEVAEGLPLVDMSRTNFWPLCPLMVKPIKCDPTGRFRSFTGHCNNLDNPTWGASQTPYVRYLAPRHADGVEEFRRSVVDDAQLPPARMISSSVHRDTDRPSGDLSLFIMVFGQIVDHELTQAAPPRDENGLDFNCCKEPNKSQYCSPIRIPENDPLYRKYGQTCMDFKRSLVGLRPNCRLGPRVHINTITPTIDGNIIYGSTKAVSDQLRSFSNGQLKVQNVFKSMKMKPLLPKQTIRPDLDCFERPDNMFCFLAGDDRVNEQPTLTAMHTILVRDHNRVAGQLAKINPHWNDERTFHETRHLMAAKIANLIQSEYLPMLIGSRLMEMNNLTASQEGVNYDPEIVPGIGQAFTTAAFRQGHTFIQGQLRLHDSHNFKFIESISLRHLFKRPFHYYNPGQIDKVLAGALNTPAQSYDPFITQEIAGHLFQEPGEDFGMDLISINLQRGREQGVPGYVAYRERFTQLPKVRTFEDLLTTMSNRTVNLYSRLYRSVHDIDLWSGGVSELPRDGALVGPTFAAIIGYQFAQIKNGDRFWFENPNQPSSFTTAQLKEIRKFTLARLLCVNSDGIHLIQRKALKLPHQIYNPLMACKDLNDIDLKYWKEDPNTPGQFFE